METLMKAQTETLADFRPLRAWRYDWSKFDAREVMAPPYDVISPAAQDSLYQKSLYNCVRLILNKIEEADTETNNRYSRARDCFQAWKKDGVLVRDDKPCFYIYRQSFKDPRNGRQHVRSAFLGALKLEPFENQIVIPHERTLAKPRADRRRLLEATNTNFSPVFGLFEDPQSELVAMLEDLTAGKPLFDISDEENVTHTLWSVTDEKQMGRIRQSLSRQRIYIADGHHRYQTALEYSREKRAGARKDELQPSDFIYMALVSFHDSGLILLPTHRLVTGLKDIDEESLIKALEEFFDVSKVSQDEMGAALEKSPDQPSLIGLAFQNTAYLLALRDAEKAKARMLPGKPAVWYQLDVNLFAYLILKSVLGVPESDWEAHLKFTHSDGEALEAVKQGAVQAAFLLKPPNVRVLSDMGRVQELMPQKSTYFYPKLASGLLFYQHEENAVL